MKVIDAKLLLHDLKYIDFTFIIVKFRVSNKKWVCNRYNIYNVYAVTRTFKFDINNIFYQINLLTTKF